MRAGLRWQIERLSANATDLIRLWDQAPSGSTPRISLNTVTGLPAVVVGSATPERWIRPSAGRGTPLGPTSSSLEDVEIDVVRRKSGGGAVVVSRDAQVWIDFWIPRGDVLWNDDVVNAALWVGETWARALVSLGVERSDLDIHAGRLVSSRWSDVVCFAGIGPGEVLVRRLKLVGVAQRRNSYGSWFQTVSLVDWDPKTILATLDRLELGPDAHKSVEAELTGAATGLREVISKTSETLQNQELIALVENAVVAALPS
ncbi:MAG TPA: hypothetical protein VEJ87_11780 [Acidimicrobiales bacterium]|nr:hypothetical protein [Acidimicrobiales bacterium]